MLVRVWLLMLTIAPLAVLAVDRMNVELELLTIRTIHVEKLNGGEEAAQIRDMIISCLQRTGLFVLTEKPDRADAVLKGSAEDLIYNETHDTREGATGRGSINLGSTRSSSRYRRGISLSASGGEDESSRIVERRHEATAAVRLVKADGDIIWSTVQESGGAKFRGASVDVADKITKQLVTDMRRLRSLMAIDTGIAPGAPAEAGGR
ncbi:MAG: hypothetical protein GY953_21010 [bacterium]|nr:hypothetical protein [bacterium]